MVYHTGSTVPTVSHDVEQLKTMVHSVISWSSKFFQEDWKTHKWDIGCYEFNPHYYSHANPYGLIYVKYGDFLVSDNIQHIVYNTYNMSKMSVDRFAMWREFTRVQLDTLRSHLSELKWEPIEVEIVRGNPEWMSEVQRVTLLFNQPRT